MPTAPEDFRGVFEREFDYVWSTLRRLGVHARDLEDVVHDVFVHVFRHLPEYDATRPLRPWLFGFAFRVARDYRKLARHRVELLADGVEPIDESVPADERVAVEERRRIVERALDAIEIERRAVFILHDIDGVPVPEIAATLGIPTNTAYSRLRLAREDFAAAARRIRASQGER